MSESFTHIILTRFNSVLDKEFTMALNATWISERWNLFVKYTVPSMLGQSCQKYYWIIEFHPDSPPFLRELIHKAGWPAHFVPSFGEREKLPGLLRFSDSSVVLTSRIDSDDSYHRDAIHRIQTAGFECDVLNFEHGFQCDHVTGCLALVHRHSSAFSTKINRSSRGDDPFDVGGDHSLLSQKYSYKDISRGDPMFLQVLHGKNVGNSWCGNPFNNRPLSELLLKKCFNVEQTKFPLKERLARIARYEVQRIPRAIKKAYASERKSAKG